MRWIYVAVGIVFGVILDRVFGVPLWNLVRPIFQYLSIPWLMVLGLTIVVLPLLLLIDGARRLHKRTLSELNEKHSTIARRIWRLGEVIGQAGAIDQIYRDKEDEAPKEVFQIWVGYLKMALTDTFGPSAISEFTNGHPESLDVPDQRHVWFLFLREQLSQVMGRQIEAFKKDASEAKKLGS